mgnify:CR=1 FL=1
MAYTLLVVFNRPGSYPDDFHRAHPGIKGRWTCK